MESLRKPKTGSCAEPPRPSPPRGNDSPPWRFGWGRAGAAPAGGGAAASGEGALEDEAERGRRLADRLLTLLEALPAGVLVLDASGRVEQCNTAAVELLDRDPHGELWREVVSEAFSPRMDDGCDVSLRSGRRVSITTCSLGAEPGQIVLLNDVSERRELEDKLARVQRLSEMGGMMACLAHQIRTPLACALLHASALRGTQASEGGRQAALKIVDHLRHLEHLVNDMLRFARNEHLEVSRVKARELLALLGESVDGPHTVIDLAGVAEDAVVTCNVEALSSVFDNLVENARHAGGSGVSLALRSKTVDDEVLEIALSDDGPGMAETLRAKVFEPFVTTRARGIGLGLAIARRIVEAHGGDIAVRSAPGEGSTFLIRLPSRLEPAGRSQRGGGA